MNSSSAKFSELLKKLREIFQIDRPELDFGIYRILNARAGEINDYLENRLQEKVKAALASGNGATQEQTARELKEKEAQYHADGLDPDKVPKIQALRQKLAAYGNGAAEHQDAVFSHLLIFFSRYYDNGDFISQRRYKGDTYAIPYAGEEVMLHWANKDQYYTKSGENFSNYSFKLDDGMGNARLVHFRLVAADTAKDNRKDNDKERRFALIERKSVTRSDEDGGDYVEEMLPVESVDKPVMENGNEVRTAQELILRFEYKAMPKGSKQETLNSQAVKAILADPAVKAAWLDLGQRAPTEKDPQRTLLEKHLSNYTAKNSADYFIHKDLGGFLKRELDFYIKNEVMQLDDVQNAGQFADIEKSLRMIQCLRAIALELISFLAQLENFQKKLWLKKKFVVAANYCITLDRIPEEFYPEIASNEKQLKSWAAMNLLQENRVNDSLQVTIGVLKNNRFLMIDSSLFTPDFTQRLLSTIEEINSHIEGLLIHGDNFQGLNFLQSCYQNSLNAIYIDPPYNTDASAIMYKNGYKDASWLTLMHNRLGLAHHLMRDDGLISVAIDDQEVSPLREVMTNIFHKEIGIAVVKSNPQSRKTKGKFSPVHEYALFYGKSETSLPYSIGYNQSKAARYPLTDDQGRYSWMNFIRAGSNDLREDRPKLFYPIAVNRNNEIRIPKIEWDDRQRAYNLLEEVQNDERLIYPIKYIDGKYVEKNWQRGHKRVTDEYSEYRVRRDNNDEISIDFKTRMDEEAAPVTWWDKGEYASANYGAAELKDLFSEKNFDFPKARKLVEDSLKSCGAAEPNSKVIDFFGGSGTTAHAVISITRETKEKHHYIVVEQGEYFDTVIKPRVQKVVYSANWKDGKPTAPETGISHAFKVLKLESYEDTLNNLELRRTNEQADLLSSLSAENRDDYLLHYMLDVESRGSLLSVDAFRKPFDVSLKVAVDSAGAMETRKIDLVETFNYLIGLTVKKMELAIDRGYARIVGTLPSGENTLILWRDCERIGYEELMRDAEGYALNPREKTYDVVYINGDHNTPATLTETEAEGGTTRTLKLRQIEPEFLSRMFAGEEV